MTPVDGRPWRLRVDTGGTFTDCLATDPAGGIHEVKVLSTSALRGVVVARDGPRRLRVRLGLPVPAGLLRGMAFRPLAGADGEARSVRVREHDPGTGLLHLGGNAPTGAEAGAAFEVVSHEEAPVLAARLVTGTAADGPLPPLEMRLATTRGTNALLERAGARTVLFATEGHGDLLEIGTQQRPDLFALRIRKRRPLPEVVEEVDGRLDAAGREVRPLQRDRVRERARALRRAGFDTAAVALLHAWRNPAHERAVAAMLREAGFRTVVLSSEVAALVQALPRTETAVVEAFLARAVGDYLDRVRAGLGDVPLHVMTSAGGLVRGTEFRARDGLLSGPAGGVVGAAAAGRRAGAERVLTLDMGGTSTDVARWAGDFEYVFEHGVGDVRLLAPALAVETVAAGGGSLCRVEAGRLLVGPGSAGASPGPACYGAGGPLTLTDVNLLLGRLDAAEFPIPVDRDAARRALADALDALAASTGERPAPEALLEGFLAIADERMAEAIRAVSLDRGHDPADHALVAFGGAGGQHACSLADRLGITTVILPPRAGVLSAEGLAAASVERFAEEQVLLPLSGVAPDLPRRWRALEERARAAVAAEGVAADRVGVRRRILGLRWSGQDAVLPVDALPGEDPGDAFRRRYAEVFGHLPEGREVELESLRVVAWEEPDAGPPAPPAPAPSDAIPAGEAEMRIGGRTRTVPRFRREVLGPGARVPGPALVLERFGAVVIAEGWTGAVDGGGALVLRRSPSPVAAAPHRRAPAPPPRPMAVERELFTGRFRALALEMGERLRRTAVSVNVKERLDFSCALLDPDGRLVVNAPHIPVHLGSLGLCVRTVRDAVPMGPGDVVVTNHPAFGGSHLPDVTVLGPVHGERGGLLGWVAARAHHAELGGIRPGSMPPAARCLAEEGVVLPPLHLVRGGVADLSGVRARLEGGPWPSRAVGDNMADLAAAVAAVRHGAEGLRRLAVLHGRDAVVRHMAGLQAHAARLLGDALERLGDGRRTAEDRMDDGTPVRVALTVRGRRARIDFTGSGDVHPGSLNATPAVVRSAVLYCLRLLVDAPLPLNEGLLDPVSLRIPRGFLDPHFPDDPRDAPAVVGGNVETSQRVVDVVLRAFGACAAGQGTMNNVVFGDASFGYYETVGGGSGAGPGFDGADAIQVHMTNTRITDVEVLEHRYPVRVERFSVRRGSGGAGLHRGGDGILRALRFLAPCSLSLLAERRTERPFGLAGGAPGSAGSQCLVRPSGEVLPLAGHAALEVEPGDLLVLETPGGGGWGEA